MKCTKSLTVRLTPLNPPRTEHFKHTLPHSYTSRQADIQKLHTTSPAETHNNTTTNRQTHAPHHNLHHVNNTPCTRLIPQHRLPARHSITTNLNTSPAGSAPNFQKQTFAEPAQTFAGDPTPPPAATRPPHPEPGGAKGPVAIGQKARAHGPAASSSSRRPIRQRLAHLRRHGPGPGLASQVV